ncbi:hypothetical protein GYMLUDRAFT_723781 [Collybiopsis luxurians FD-317 M1]|nr:hypothetical protein GYMLUDRAFT_723781 [Collybiopsis luxurians FD-317 M1]
MGQGTRRVSTHFGSTPAALTQTFVGIDRVAPSVSTTPDTSARDGIANPPPPPPRNPGLPGGSPDSSSSSESNNSRRSGDHGDSSPRSQNGSPDGGQGNGLSYPVWPSTGVSPSNLFPYPGSALPPLPPPSIHYHFAVPTPVPITPQPALQPVLPPPLWSTPAVPSILLTPAGPPPAWEPGTFPVSNLGDPVPVRVHPHLLYNPMNPSQPVLQWDVVLRAEQARVVTGKGLITRPSLGDEAVYVGGKIDKIWIQSDTPILAWWMQRWGPIIIEKSRITVRDVLDAIQTYLSVPLTNGDYRKAVQVQTQTDGINHGNGIRLLRARRMRALNGCELRSVALKRRSIEDGWSARFMGANQGESSFYRRSDVLGTYRRFLGVRSVVYSDNSWRLLLGVGPGPVPQFV